MIEKTKPVNTTHELRGLEADNLLAFLALLGLLRALERTKPHWKPRIVWRGRPPLALLQLDVAVAPDDVARATDEGVRAIGRAYKIGKEDIVFTREEFRELSSSARSDNDAALLLAALASDGALKRGDGEKVEPTPLCAMFGQGHQHFLQRLTSVAKQKSSQDVEKLSDALFEPWKYDDNTDSFRWDPIEDRRYAHQFGDPSDGKNKVGTVAGANRLAAIGLSLLTCVPGGFELKTIAVTGGRRERDVCWPIVRVPVSLDAYLALLMHPRLGSEDKARELASYGVEAVARARRYQVGKFFNFERGRVQYL